MNYKEIEGYYWLKEEVDRKLKEGSRCSECGMADFVKNEVGMILSYCIC